MKNVGQWALCMALAVASMAAVAQNDSMQPPPGGAPPGGAPHGPPPEAIEACKGKAEGAEVSFTMRDRKVSGTCQKDGEVLAARPAGMPPGGPGGGKGGGK
ncbi:hypothetical protein ACLB1G_08130 [Oxalobacteraceae bacterium A2-2]